MVVLVLRLMDASVKVMKHTLRATLYQNTCVMKKKCAPLPSNLKYNLSRPLLFDATSNDQETFPLTDNISFTQLNFNSQQYDPYI